MSHRSPTLASQVVPEICSRDFLPYQLAHDPAAAAIAASVPQHAIKLAVNEQRVAARDCGGVHIILRDDMKKWLEQLSHVQ